MCLCLVACSCSNEFPSSPIVLEAPQETTGMIETTVTVGEAEVVTCEYAINAIATILDTTYPKEDLYSYAMEHKYLLYLDGIKLGDVISYRDAAVMLYNALCNNPHSFDLETVIDQREVIGLDDAETAERGILFLYRWGILYGEVPTDWYDEITSEALEEMLIRLQTPELRRELLPDASAQVRNKLDEAFLCACVQQYSEADLLIAKNGLSEFLLGQENLQAMLNCSYWFFEQASDGVFYLSMLTGIEEAIIFSRYSYDIARGKGQVSEVQILAPCDLSVSEINITYAACADEEKKNMLENQLLEQYLEMIKKNAENYSRFFEEYTVAYAAPRQGNMSLLLACFDGNTLHSETFFCAGGNINSVCDQLAQSWYHVYDEG